MLLPALAMKAPIDFNTVTEEAEGGGNIGGSAKPGADESLKYTDIASTLKSIADGLLPYYGEDCIVRIFHRRWQFREEGVGEFIGRMPGVFEKA